MYYFYKTKIEYIKCRDISMKYEYSIIIPVYQSQEIIRTTVEKILAIIVENKLSAEVILINDGSKDNSWNIIKSLALKNKNVRAFDFVKNYGQHNALMCGFRYATGSYIITMDDDLQNPASELLKLINKIKNSDFDLVFGKFKQKQHTLFRKLGSKIVSYLNEKIFQKPKWITITNFRIIRSDLIKRVLNHRTAYPYVPGLLLMYASNICNVSVEHAPRRVGKSNYTLRKITSLTSRLLINYSSYPLRLISLIGLFVATISFLMSVTYLIHGHLYGSQVPGWTTLVVLISFFGGFIIALLALIGEYLARILIQMSGDKVYHIKEVIE